MNRTSFPGIAEAWIARSDGTPGPPMSKKVIKVLLDCLIESDVSDITIDITTIAASCLIETDVSDITIDITTLSASCAMLADENDIGNAITTISLICAVEVV